MKPNYLKTQRTIIVAFWLTAVAAAGQSGKHATTPAFITDNQTHSVISIPNKEQYYQFKIYKKDTLDTTFNFVATVTIPEKQYLYSKNLPYGIDWTDETSCSSNAEYRIEAFNRLGTKICDVKVIRQARKQYASCL